MAITIQIWFGLARFRKDFSVRISSQWRNVWDGRRTENSTKISTKKVLSERLATPGQAEATPWKSSNIQQYMIPRGLRCRPLQYTEGRKPPRQPVNIFVHWENYISISFHIEWDMIEGTVFLSILNQMEFHLVQKIERETVPTIISHSIWKEMGI